MASETINTDIKEEIQENVSRLSISKQNGAINTRSKRRRSSAAKFANSPKPCELLTKEKKRKNNGVPMVEYDSSKKVKFSLLRDFALFLADVTHECPSAFTVKNRASIIKTVLVVIPGLDTELFGIDNSDQLLHSVSPETPLKFITEHFNQALITTAPGEKDTVFPLMKAFTTKPFTRKEKTNLKNVLSSKKLVLDDLKVPLDDLLTNGYRIHPLTEGYTGQSNTQNDGWVDTYEFDHEGSHTFALDCEMCESANGKVLTRISMIDFNENVLIDELVKPNDEIIDYLTAHSGITEEKLRNVTTTLEDIQKKILEIVSSNDYLIGHSLENDLNVLKIRHPKIIDTALVFDHPRGPPFKSSLKYLTNKYLQRVIQEGSHDSIEDSKSCLDLVKLKLVEGALLGKVLDGQSIFNILTSKNKKGAILDYNRVQPFQENFFQCKDDDEVTEKLIELIDSKDLIVANLKEIEFNNSKPDEEKINQESLFRDLNDRLETIYKSLPKNTAFIITTGHGDLTKIKELGNRKKDFARDVSNSNVENLKLVWNTEDDNNLRELTKQARTGVSFITFKTSDPEIKEEIV